MRRESQYFQQLKPRRRDMTALAGGMPATLTATLLPLLGPEPFSSRVVPLVGKGRGTMVRTQTPHGSLWDAEAPVLPVDWPVPAALPCFVTGPCLPWSVRRGLWPSQGPRPLLIHEWMVRPSQLCTESESLCWCWGQGWLEGVDTECEV